MSRIQCSISFRPGELSALNDRRRQRRRPLEYLLAFKPHIDQTQGLPTTSLTEWGILRQDALAQRRQRQQGKEEESYPHRNTR